MDVWSKNRICLIVVDLCPPGNPNRLKNMPRGVGSISTPADFISATFKISLFRGQFVISSKKSLFKKSKPCMNLEIYCITKKWHTHQKMRNVQHIGKSGIDIKNDFMRVELLHFPSENVEKRRQPAWWWGKIEGPACMLFFKRYLVFFNKYAPF